MDYSIHIISDDVIIDSENHLITIKPDTELKLKVESLSEEAAKEVRWMVSPLFNMGLGAPEHSGTGNVIALTFPSVYSGGGILWVEPLVSGAKDLRGRPPYGFFVKIEGPRSIDKIEWREYHNENIGQTVQQDKFFTEAVQLHIHTTGLYGHSLMVELLDNDKLNFDDELNLDENINDNLNSLAKYFTREVKVYTKSDAENNVIEIKQKVIINIFLEKRWEDIAGSNLTIYPVISAKGIAQKEFKNTPLNVRKRKTNDRTIVKSNLIGNKPTIIGNVPTDAADFQPCFYASITATVMRGEEKIQDEVVVYKQGEGLDEEVLYLPVVAGTQYAKAPVKLTLDTDTDDCILEHTHKGRVIDLGLIPGKIVVESRTSKPKPPQLFGTEAKTRDSADENDGDNRGEHLFLETNFDGPIGFRTFRAHPDNLPEIVYRKDAESDKEVEIEVAYDFTQDGEVSFIRGLFSNLWPISGQNAKNYPIRFYSCRKYKKVIVQVFPDVKWLLQVNFNYDQEKFNQMLSNEHKKYEAEIQQLETEYKREVVSDAKRRSDLIEYLARAEKRGDSEKIENWKHKISKIDEKIANKRDKIGTDEKRDDAKSDRNEEILDNLEPDDALEDGIANVRVGLAVEWDRPYKGAEVSLDYQKAKAFIDFIITIERKIRKLIKGEDNKSEASSDLKKLEDALKGRPLFTFEIMPPSIGIALSWYAEHPKTDNTPSMGVVWEGEFKTEPLIGLEFNFDILALVQKVHPIARGIITVMDLVASLADEAEIRLDFNVQGELNLAGKGRINTHSKKTNFNRAALAKDEDDSPFAFSGEIEFALIAQIKLINKSESWLFGDVTTAIDTGAKALTGITAEGKVKADDAGIYLQPTITFHGVKAVFHLTVEASAKRNEDSDPYAEFSPVDTQKTLILMPAYEWGSKKWYLTGD